MNTNDSTMNPNASAMTTNNNILVVRTEKELEKVLTSKCPHFIFEGPQATEIYAKMEAAESKRRSARNTGIGLGLLCLLAVPFTGGTSLLGMGAVAGGVALSTELIISGVIAISIAAIEAIRDYHIKKLERDRLEFIRK